MRLADFHYDLPARLIARHPLATRTASRLMCLANGAAGLAHRTFADVLDLVNPGDLMIFNDTRVMPARLLGRKSSGGQVEMLVERILNPACILAQARASKALVTGSLVQLTATDVFEVMGREGQFYKLRYEGEHASVLDLIEAMGQIPLPPYLHRAPDEEDRERYQTVYAVHKGSVAAPTAGLHFDAALLQRLRDKQVELGYLTLHIGAGTFAPIRVDDIQTHKMHAEYFQISADLCAQIIAARARGNRVIAVGTTTLRALEAASQGAIISPWNGETTIFIYPGYHFRSADVLITNLHLPASTLLMLVCAFGGQETVMHAYREAVAQQYRFYSYGDAMWVPHLVP